MANNEKRFEVDGVVTDVLPGGKFKVKCDDTDHTCVCTLSGKMRQAFIKIIKGDRVTIDLSATTGDISIGRIVWRYK